MFPTTLVDLLLVTGRAQLARVWRVRIREVYRWFILASPADRTAGRLRRREVSRWTPDEYGRMKRSREGTQRCGAEVGRRMMAEVKRQLRDRATVYRWSKPIDCGWSEAAVAWESNSVPLRQANTLWLKRSGSRVREQECTAEVSQ